MTEIIVKFVGELNSIVWGPWMLVAIVGVGVFLMLRLALMPLRRLGDGFRMLWRGRKPEGEGDIAPFNALMTSLAATIGTGNIAGVATAISIGGPGALFWMWVTALVGMATKYSEAVLAVRFRETDDNGKHVGGPMYYIKNGLGRKWRWLGIAFAFFGGFAGFGIGNMVQTNSIAAALDDQFNVDPIAIGIVLSFLVGAVMIGGITRIGTFASILVPFMAFLYLFAGIAVLVINAAALPDAIATIFTTAFTGTAAAGGFVGATIWAAIRFGVMRGVFSNEAGLGSAPIAHAAATTKNPVRQGSIAMLDPLIDTIIVCSITGLAIVSTGVWTSGVTGVDLTAMAFEKIIPGGQYIVILTLVIFAFTTVLGWSYYGEKCWQFLLGIKSIEIYRLAWVVAIFIGPWALSWEGGTKAGIEFIWLLADTLNALMALPNLIALALLSPVVVKLTKEYYGSSNRLPPLK